MKCMGPNGPSGVPRYAKRGLANQSQHQQRTSYLYHKIHHPGSLLPCIRILPYILRASGESSFSHVDCERLKDYLEEGVRLDTLVR